MEHNMH